MVDLDDQPEEVDLLPDEPVGNRFLEPDVDQLVQVLHHRFAAEQLDHVGGVQARVGPENKACLKKNLRKIQASGRKNAVSNLEWR